ncbi:hypothetical protein EMA8858_04199 [Emticicia aquatica]|uniref:Uncharacterized protein n=1 Tax=Emticicia aquatica TaxID=1681835 RepID=A0ABM9AWY0_9BACT|nr:hypothetical protein EMA8858_04199 [Emticicia aquatica]
MSFVTVIVGARLAMTVFKVAFPLAAVQFASFNVKPVGI